jgi:hypothetical protein
MWARQHPADAVALRSEIDTFMNQNFLSPEQALGREEKFLSEGAASAIRAGRSRCEQRLPPA